MCGIVAIISKSANGLTKEETEAFDALLYVDALRGMDSTGVFSILKDGSMHLAKSAEAAHNFRQAQEYKDLMNQSFRTGMALVGHNRAATKGVITDANAHPFVVDDRITLIHNGTLWGDHKKLADVDVDSHAIAHTIHKYDDDVEAALQELSGAYALIWHDFKLKSINIVRNSQRPLHWIETDKCWIYASEMNMIEWILARFSFKPVGKIASQMAGMLTTFKQEGNQWDVSSRPLTLEKPAKTYTSYSGGSAEQSANTFRQYNAGWFDDDGISYASLSKEERDELKPKPPAPVTHMSRYRATTELLKSEDALAKAHQLNCTFETYKVEAEYIDVNEWHMAQCVEYDYADASNHTLGYVVYAVMEEHPDYMVRYMAPPELNEYDILDLCLNNRMVQAKIATKSWRAFKDQNAGDGFGMFYAKEMRPLLTDISLGVC